MKSMALFLMMMSVWCLQPAKANLNEIQFLTEEYPPYNFTEQGRLQGIAVDLLLKASKMAGQPIDRQSIQIQPWARAYRNVFLDANTALFSMTRTELRESLFYWVGPIIQTRIVVMARRSSGIAINHPTDLAKYKIGVIRDDVGEQLLLEAGVPRDSLQESSYAASIAEQLYKQRIDLWAYEENVARWWLAKSGYKVKDFKPVYVLQDSDLYFAFNLNVDPETIAKLQQAVDAIKSNEESYLNDLVSSYTEGK